MLKQFFSASPIAPEKSVAVVRIVLGLLVVYHGQEIFHPDIMEVYLSWEVFGGSGGNTMAYLGKSFELISGVFLLLGLFTRLGALLLMGSLTFVTFFIGQGRFWYEDQHPFMFVLIGAIFLFYGPGAWSLDRLLFEAKKGT